MINNFWKIIVWVISISMIINICILGLIFGLDEKTVLSCIVGSGIGIGFCELFKLTYDYTKGKVEKS